MLALMSVCFDFFDYIRKKQQCISAEFIELYDQSDYRNIYNNNIQEVKGM